MRRTLVRLLILLCKVCKPKPLRWQTSFIRINIEIYENIESGVSAFEFVRDYIITRFGNHYYLYSDRVTGTDNKMKELAAIGKVLSSFISQNIRKNYEAMFESEKKLRVYLKSELRDDFPVQICKFKYGCERTCRFLQQ